MQTMALNNLSVLSKPVWASLGSKVKSMSGYDSFTPTLYGGVQRKAMTCLETMADWGYLAGTVYKGLDFWWLAELLYWHGTQGFFTQVASSDFLARTTSKKFSNGMVGWAGAAETMLQFDRLR